MDDKKLFLLDAYALIYRAYYAMIRSPRITSSGFNTSAIFGFCNTLDEILRKENPSHIAVCFDPKGGETFRHEVYPEYKAGRDAQPEDITLSIPYIKSIIEAYRIPVVEMPKYEADDIIGTLSRKAEAEGYVTYMMTPDKDYGQLVTDRVFMYRPALKGQGFEIRGPKEVCERYGINRPIQVIDMLALEGDASDNIPGCPGVGEKTASKLIGEWDSVENLIEHVGELKGALKKKIEENAEQIKFSKFLATIKTDVPVDVRMDDLVRKDIDTDRLIGIYEELEFRSFIAKLKSRSAADNISMPAARTAPDMDNGMGSLFDMPGSVQQDMQTASECNYQRLNGVDSISGAVNDVLALDRVGICLYAEGPDAMTAAWKGLAWSAGSGAASYVELPGQKEEREAVKRILMPLFTSPGLRVVSHDIKRDYILLKREGITLTDNYYDTSVAHYLLQPEMRHDLQSVCSLYLNYQVSGYVAAVPRTVRKQPSLTADEAFVRTCEAADMSLRLMDVFSPQLEAEGLAQLMDEVELPLIRVLAEMEWTGVRINVSELAELSRQLTERLSAMEQEAYVLAGGEFNIASPMQVGEVLFERLKIDPKAKRTKRGAYSTTEEILEKHRHTVPLVALILKIRALRKLLTTYINALPALINPVTGKIHTSYNQTVTATGRISSTNPNLQNIPVRTSDGREIRRAFIPDNGDLLLSADYSQIELRLMADMSRDPDMTEAFLSGADIHRATAAKIYHESLDSVTDDQRRKAKTANFGIIYGISAFGLSERLGIPRSEAKMLIDVYFRTYPHIKDYMDESIETARRQGYVSTIMGRKRMLPDINSRNNVVRGYAERNAINAPLQGSAADIIKLAMIRIYNRLDKAGLKSRMIMQVHDELVFNVVPEELPAVQSIVVEEMQGAYSGVIPLTVSAGVGSNWLEAH